MHQRKRLSDILQTSTDCDALRRNIAEVKRADDFAVVLAEEYVARIDEPKADPFVPDDGGNAEMGAT